MDISNQGQSLSSELQIRGGIEDNSRMIYLISQRKPHLMMGHKMFLWRNIAYYPYIIPDTPSHLEHC